MFSWLIPLVGPKAAKPAFFILAAMLLFLAGVMLSRCSGDNTAAEEQAKQGTATAEAYSEAVANGVAVIDNRTITESALAEATVEVKEEIGNAASLSDIRNSLVTKLCAKPGHEKDPACPK